jgi:hypothetical protein
VAEMAETSALTAYEKLRPPPWTKSSRSKARFSAVAAALPDGAKLYRSASPPLALRMVN